MSNEPQPNKICHYIDATTGKRLYSIPFYDPEYIYGGEPLIPGMRYTTFEEYENGK